MSEFMMLFRHAPDSSYQPSPEELQETIKQWQNWVGNIAAQGKFVGTNQLGFEGKTLKADGLVTDGPYAEIKEIVGGYVIVKSDNINDAVKLAESCPILSIGGHVEVRNIMQINT